jgi:hypothetical protein
VAGVVRVHSEMLVVVVVGEVEDGDCAALLKCLDAAPRPSEAPVQRSDDVTSARRPARPPPRGFALPLPSPSRLYF